MCISFRSVAKIDFFVDNKLDHETEVKRSDKIL